MSLFKKRSAQAPVTAEESGERRQLTVLFYDIVGSTSLVAGQEPEALRAALNQIHSAARAALTAHGGSLEQVMGDGGMAYFGYPIVSEDAALQAVEAAYDLLEARETIPNAPNIRIGIATSVVVLSEGPQGSGGQLGAVGVAPNLAARLEAAAEVNTALVSVATHALTRRAFDFTAINDLTLKGFPDETRAWRPVGRRVAATRFLRDRDGDTGLSGREAELEELRAAWATALVGRGTAILIEGEPGMGKSRIAAEIVDWAEDARLLTLQCQPRTEGEALYAFIRMFDTAYEDGRDAALCDVAVATAEAVAALEENETLSPDARRSAIVSAVADRIETLDRNKPLLILAEDLHWADEVTLAVLERLGGRASGGRVLILATMRAGTPMNGVSEIFRALDLRPIGPAAARGLVRAVTTVALSEPTVNWIVEKGDGNPLFLIELTHHAADVSARGVTLDANSGAEIGTLRDLIATRLESAGAAKRTAQIAAILGREYPYHLLKRMTTSYPPMQLDADLQRLNDHGLKEAMDNGDTYAFRHALVRDVAYDSQLRSVRRNLHGQVVDMVEAEPALRADVPDILLAEHCLAAGRVARGVGLLVDVAEDAIKRSARRAPRAVLERALALAEPLEGVEALRLRAISLLGPLVTFLDGPRAAAPLYEAGQALYFGLQAEGRAPYFPVLWGWWFTASDLVEQTRRSEVLIRDVGHDADRESRLQALHCGWATLFDGGAHDRCLHAIDEGLALYDEEEGARSRHLYGHDAKVCGLGERALSGWLTGQLDLSAQAVRDCETWGDATEHLESILHGLDIATQVAVFRQDLTELDRLRSKAQALSGAEDAPALGSDIDG